MINVYVSAIHWEILINGDNVTWNGRQGKISLLMAPYITFQWSDGSFLTLHHASCSDIEWWGTTIPQTTTTTLTAKLVGDELRITNEITA